MCNTTNITSENTYYLDCKDFGFYDYYSYCYINYEVESCHLANNTCTMWFNDANYNYMTHDCRESLMNETWWNENKH